MLINRQDKSVLNGILLALIPNYMFMCFDDLCILLSCSIVEHGSVTVVEHGSIVEHEKVIQSQYMTF